MKKELVGLSFDDLKNELERIGQKPFRAKQLWQWIYNKGETDFDKMSSLSKNFRSQLKENYTVTHPEIVVEQISTDGTRKWLMRFSDGAEIESVFIPEEDCGAVCVSTQVGCAQGCKFCNTGTQKLMRNLTAAEIVGQVMAARDALHEWPTKTDENRLLSNVVFMGTKNDYKYVATSVSSTYYSKDLEYFDASYMMLFFNLVGFKVLGNNYNLELPYPNLE